ncbi:MAG: TlpA family protein disulfide reductase [Candidatus Limnocylindria bacterium]
MRPRLLPLVVALTLVVAACAPDGTGAGGESTDPGAGGGPDPAWRTAVLTDVRTGETFTVDGLRGSLVAIEPMAIWCTTCRAQQGEAAAALDQLAHPDLVYVSLDVDPNEDAADLADYADDLGFGWRFVVATPEVAGSLADAFGPQILSPPSTPLIVVGPDGTVVEQHYGIVRAADLADQLARHLP